MRVSYLISIVLLTLSACGKESVDVEKPEVTREVGETCDNLRPAEKSFDPDEWEGCDDDSQCQAGANGRCRILNSIAFSERICTYDRCSSDAECGPEKTCSCGEDKNTYVAGRSDENICVRSNCKTNADCGDYFCKPDLHPCQSDHDRVLGYYCSTPEDECLNDSDCEARSFCLFDREQSKWRCDAYCE